MKKIKVIPAPQLITISNVSSKEMDTKQNNVIWHNCGNETVIKNAIEEFVPLNSESRIAVNTAAAHHLNRRPQTLRAWACHEKGPIRPIRPIRIHGRLAWSVQDLRQMLGCSPLSKSSPLKAEIHKKSFNCDHLEQA